MLETIFQDCLSHYLANAKEFWKELGTKYNLSSEALRSQFRRERNARGIKKSDKIKPDEVQITHPRVGVLDIESLPAEVYTFQLYDQNIGIEQVISEVCLLSWAGKFLNESKVYSDILTPEEAPEKNDKRIVQSCWDFMSRCDCIIGHNMNMFDSKMMNMFFLKHGLNPLKYVVVDTLVVAKNSFRFSSNKLAFINKQLGIR